MDRIFNALRRTPQRSGDPIPGANSRNPPTLSRGSCDDISHVGVADRPGHTPSGLTGLEHSIFNLDGGQLRVREVDNSLMEVDLQDLLELNPGILLDNDLLIIGKQVLTATLELDLLAITSTGEIWVIEVKRQTVDQSAIGQCLLYNGWAKALRIADLVEIFQAYNPSVSLAEAFMAKFGRPLPESLPARVRMVVAAPSLRSSFKHELDRLRRDYGLSIDVAILKVYTAAHGRDISRVWVTRDSHRGWHDQWLDRARRDHRPLSRPKAVSPAAERR